MKNLAFLGICILNLCPMVFAASEPGENFDIGLIPWHFSKGPILASVSILDIMGQSRFVITPPMRMKEKFSCRSESV